jgi:hypothetical protein
VVTHPLPALLAVLGLDLPPMLVELLEALGLLILGLHTPSSPSSSSSSSPSTTLSPTLTIRSFFSKSAISFMCFSICFW